MGSEEGVGERWSHILGQLVWGKGALPCGALVAGGGLYSGQVGWDSSIWGVGQGYGVYRMRDGVMERVRCVLCVGQLCRAMHPYLGYTGQGYMMRGVYLDCVGQL